MAERNLAIINSLDEERIHAAVLTSKSEVGVYVQ